jgi:hypothetical protein
LNELSRLCTTIVDKQLDAGDKTGKSFESLRLGGHILIHEMLYNDEKTGPFPVAAFSMIMLGWTEANSIPGRRYQRCCVKRDSGTSR